MLTYHTITDQDECQEAWQRAIPPELVADLWELRACFHQHFQRPLCFILAEENGCTRGLLPLSWVQEAQCYSYFPGETWQAKTWLEQNRIIEDDAGLLDHLLERIPGRYHVRYLLPVGSVPVSRQVVDEVGYLFRPPDYDYDIENYFQEFSRRSAKRLKRDIATVESHGVTYRFDHPPDFDILVSMNSDRYGAYSYFHDPRFRASFRTLMHFLQERGWLRLTTVLVNGDVAAVDMGCIHRGVYTLLGAGNDPEYVGVMKLLNVHQMQRACRERLDCVDFLCGDFKWKSLFHLEPRPLYVLSDTATAEGEPQSH